MRRVVGADVARGVAVLGMFAAHLGDASPDLWSPTGWLQVTHGRSAATFAMLAGVSAALLSGGPARFSGDRLRRARVRILVRAALLWPLGVLLVALGTPVVVILPGYAVMFAVTAAALTWARPTLVLAAVGVATAGSVLVVRVHEAVDPSGRGLPQVLDVLVGHYYPAAVWTAYLLVGIAVGRTDLLARRTPWTLIGVGVPCAVLGYGGSALALRLVAPEHTVRRALLSAWPHASTAPEVLGNVGVSLALLGACLLLARRMPRAVVPLAATGALALTAYCGHLVVIALLGDAVVWRPSNVRLTVLVLVTLVVTTAWRSRLGRGPLERALHAVSTGVAAAAVPSDAREELPVQHGEPAVGSLAPRPPGVGEQLEGDVVGEPVRDGLLGER